MVVWGFLVLGWVFGVRLLSGLPGMRSGLVVTDSLVERYGLFVIIVLGEVVVGVAQGLYESDRNVETMATGLIGLSIGFAYWWSYFDFVGRRPPVDSPPERVRWLSLHLPVTMSIAAAGAAMVSLIEHGADAATPVPTAWLLSGSVAIGLIALAVSARTLVDFYRFPSLFRPVTGALAITAGTALLLGWLAPAPWALAALLVLALLVLWFFAISRWLRLEDPEAALP